jgi:hypothetical protein
MKYFFLICFSLFSGSLFAQQSETRTQEQDLMRWIFSQIAKTDTIKIERYHFRRGQLRDLQTEFSEKEYAYLVSQLQNVPETWETGLSEKAVITQIKPGNKYYTFTTPLFSSDGQYAVYVKEYRCGNLCGEGNIIVLHKTNTGWEIDNKKLKKIYTWVF